MRFFHRFEGVWIVVVEGRLRMYILVLVRAGIIPDDIARVTGCVWSVDGIVSGHDFGLVLIASEFGCVWGRFRVADDRAGFVVGFGLDLSVFMVGRPRFQDAVRIILFGTFEMASCVIELLFGKTPVRAVPFLGFYLPVRAIVFSDGRAFLRREPFDALDLITEDERYTFRNASETSYRSLMVTSWSAL